MGGVFSSLDGGAWALTVGACEPRGSTGLVELQRPMSFSPTLTISKHQSRPRLSLFSYFPRAASHEISHQCVYQDFPPDRARV